MAVVFMVVTVLIHVAGECSVSFAIGDGDMEMLAWKGETALSLRILKKGKTTCILCQLNRQKGRS